MTTFTISALIITFIVLGLLIWPLRKNRNSISYARQAQNIHYAKERIKELDEQLKNASISATDYESLKLEIESTLADDIDIAKQNESQQTEAHTPKSNAVLITLLCITIPLGALGVYLIVGMPNSFLISEQSKSLPSPEEVNEMLATMEQHLQSKPNDVEGWTLLSNSYFKLGRYDDAKRGLLKLLELKGETPELLTTIADASALAAGGNLTGESQQYIERALAIDPNFSQALWMAGLSAAQKQDNQGAIKYWQQLLPQLADAPQQQDELRVLIEQAQGQIQSQLNGNNPIADQSGDSKMVEAVPANGIKVSVSIAQEVADKAKPTDLVFVFAKATKGPPAPLAVKRLTVADLPTTIYLSDADAMLEQFKLSLFDDVSVSARVAKSGNPIAQKGDIESDAVKVKNNTKEQTSLVISSEIQ